MATDLFRFPLVYPSKDDSIALRIILLLNFLLTASCGAIRKSNLILVHIFS